MRFPSNITQFQPAADRSNEACRLITAAIQHRLPEVELHAAPHDQLYAIVLANGRSSVGRVPEFDAEDDSAAADGPNAPGGSISAVSGLGDDDLNDVDSQTGATSAAEFAAQALAADAADGTIAFATAVDRTPVSASAELITWAISSYVPEQFAAATLLTVVYRHETPMAAISQTTQYWASELLPFEEAMANVVSWVDSETEVVQAKVGELATLLVPSGGRS